MVVLADELLEAFFETDLNKSWQLELPVVETPVRTGFLGGLFQALATDENKVICLAIISIAFLTSIHNRNASIAWQMSLARLSTSRP